ncbi:MULTISPECIES: amino acid ABC transporter permease [unclassified Pseudodesulfovibrio]|uniref:amino acid ABC transporter permease n=1 Tax=unclassified Pseudodesulfovibrio TaxID=2661612 RepID=UPI000FEB6F30|nr:MULTISPECIES: amino acid ABC transporter permease [unclassified Pseudodesulfovibrio]MCJ2163733.1 amino acid ABC transporter permease [Pseudodesulfovibrio sp. S3-i]RWU06013.1 amino acid ABC transporter permease [Pseudodesulfovibrio sp. S3]
MTPLDAAVLAALAGVLGFVFYKAATGLNYHWNWDIIPQFLLRYDEQTRSWRPGPLTLGLFATIRLSLWSGILAMILGLIISLFRVSPSLFKRQIGTTYVGLIRNTPPLVLIFIFYFFIGDQIISLLGVDTFVYTLSDGTKDFLSWFFGPMNRFPQFISALITLALFEAAYIAEILRAGIESVEKGQWEASASMGMSRSQSMLHVILPQALQRMLPALAGQFISIVKDSAIVSVISIEELTFQAQQLMTTTYRSFEIWTLVLIIYFVLTFLCSLAVRKLELTLKRD